MDDKYKESWVNRLLALSGKATDLPWRQFQTGAAIQNTAWRVWAAQVEAALRDLLGDDHTYVRTLNTIDSYVDHQSDDVNAVRTLLAAVITELQEGWLDKEENRIRAAVYTDLLDLAEHLLSQGQKDPAAMIAGAILEEGMRRIATTHGITLKRDDELQSLNTRLAHAGVYNRLVQKELAPWIEVRNLADHGRFGEYQDYQVEAMLRGVPTFLAQHT